MKTSEVVPLNTREDEVTIADADELSDGWLEQVVGGTSFAAADQRTKARHPNHDGVVILYSSLPGGGS